jgi:uncharacterized protein with HEPN domain
MPSDLKDAAPLWDMLDAARAILDFIQEKNAEDYFRDRMLRGAVERHLEIIGLRNILAHEYGEIKHERIWDLVVQEIPELVRLLKVLVPSSD